jgi:hypothetical protein
MNDNEKNDCSCAVCAVGRLIDQKLSKIPTDEEVNEVFRGLAVGVAAVASMNTNPDHVVRAFLQHLQHALTEMQVGTKPGAAELETAPPLNQRH